MQLLQGSIWRRHAAGMALAVLVFGGVGKADTICVPDDHDTIQAAIEAALPGDEICVRPGTYHEAIDFLGKAVRLYSTDGPETTIIDASGLESPVVTCESGEGPEAILDGFTITGGDPGDYGGGMLIRSSRPTVMNSHFVDNAARHGGGMYNWYSDVTVTNCTFSLNTATLTGGGMYNYRSDPVITNCRFNENVAAVYGGGMANTVSDPTLMNGSFIGNSAETGGAMSNMASEPIVSSSTFVDNTADEGRAFASVFGTSHVRINNSILWDGGDELSRRQHSTFVVTYSNVHGGYEGPGNIDADPLCDADGRPQAGSPCIDAGVNNAVPADRLDLDEDGDQRERLPLDIDGNPRFMDDGATEDTGCGPVVVDMGACEFTGEPVHPVLIGDIDLDGLIGVEDLVELLAAFGQCEPGCCPADVDFSWAVDFEDLLIVLNNWS